MDNNEEKRFGLLVPKKALSVPKPGNIFGDNEDSDDDSGTDWVKKALKETHTKNKTKKQTRLDMEKALEEDPTIYEYDQVYDDMKREKDDSKADKKKEAKKPKYIENLLKTAERRKREQEHRIERMVQKEREAEGAQFADKESFVTSAYRAKLEEFKKLEEEEARMDRLETIGDVTKQQDMSGFYRHLYEETVGGKADLPEAEEESSGSQAEKAGKSGASLKSTRQYRKRAAEETESSESEAEKMDADAAEDDKDVEIDKELRVEDKMEDKRVEEAEKKSPVKVEIKVEKNVGKKLKLEESREVLQENKISIWEKRTVGDVFESALQKYYERKALRLST